MEPKEKGKIIIYVYKKKVAQEVCDRKCGIGTSHSIYIYILLKN